MNAISIVFGIILSMFYYLKYRNILFPGIVFNIWWIIILLISSINFFGFYKVSLITSVIIFLGLICFNIPCFLFASTKKPKYLGMTNAIQLKEYISIKKLMIVQIIITIFLIPLVIKAYGIITNFGWYTMRNVYALDINNFMSTFERMFYIHYIIFPCATLCFLISSVLWASGRIKFSGLIIGIINMLFIACISAGRMVIFNSLAYLFIAYILFNTKMKSNRQNKLSKKKKCQIIFIICVALVFVVYITLKRSTQVNSQLITFFKTLVVYFTGGIQVLDIAISNPSAFGFNEFTFGTIFIGGILSIILTLIYYLPFTNINANFPSQYAQYFLNQNINISSNQSINAFATMYYYFIRDFGFIGVVVLTTLFSIICIGIYDFMRKKNSLFSIILYAQSFVVIFYSVCWWEPFRSEFWAFLLHCIWLIPFLTKSKKWFGTEVL